MQKNGKPSNKSSKNSKKKPDPESNKINIQTKSKSLDDKRVVEEEEEFCDKGRVVGCPVRVDREPYKAESRPCDQDGEKNKGLGIICETVGAARGTCLGRGACEKTKPRGERVPVV